MLLQGSVGDYEGRSVYDDKVTNRLDIYNLSTNQWSHSPIIAPYNSYAVAAVDNKLITLDGLGSDDEVTSKVLVLDTGQWKDFS